MRLIERVLSGEHRLFHGGIASCRNATGMLAVTAIICLGVAGGPSPCRAAEGGGAVTASGETPPAENKDAKVIRTKKFGSHSGDRYQRGGRDLTAWIIGFDRTKATIMGRPMIGMLEPVYERKAGVENETEDRIVAKEGYVVGEVELDVDTFLRAVRVKFYRLKDGKVDASDAYESRWIGKRKNRKTIRLPGQGEKIVGIYGTADEAIRSIGLLVVAQ